MSISIERAAGLLALALWAALSNAITPEEHTRMCRMTDAAIDARCYISERKWGAA